MKFTNIFNRIYLHSTLPFSIIFNICALCLTKKSIGFWHDPCKIYANERRIQSIYHLYTTSIQKNVVENLHVQFWACSKANILILLKLKLLLVLSNENLFCPCASQEISLTSSLQSVSPLVKFKKKICIKSCLHITMCIILFYDVNLSILPIPC